MDKTNLRWPLLACLGAFWLLAGCNTVEGVGQDVEAAGDAIEDAADRRQRDRD